jgi:hypothetical protein
MLRFFVPAYQDAPKAVHPRVGPLDDPAPSLLARSLVDRLCFLAPRPHMRGELKLHQEIAHFLIVVPCVEAHALRWRLRWLRTLDDKAVNRGPHPFHVMSVGTIQHQSNGDTMPLSQQTALDPALGAIGGMWPGFFPPEWRLGHRAVHAQPVPVNALQLVKRCHSRVPELPEDIRGDPRLKPVVCGGLGTSLDLVQGFPLASRPEDVKNGIGTAAIRDTGPPASTSMPIHRRGEQRFEDGPQRIGNAKPGRRPMVWRA